MLNYAEAMVELGEFSQSVADMTINKIRSRANVPSMIVSQINEVLIRSGIWVIRDMQAIMPYLLSYGKYAGKDVSNCFQRISVSTTSEDGRSAIMP